MSYTKYTVEKYVNCPKLYHTTCVFVKIILFFHLCRSLHKNLTNLFSYGLFLTELVCLLISFLYVLANILYWCLDIFYYLINYQNNNSYGSSHTQLPIKNDNINMIKKINMIGLCVNTYTLWLEILLPCLIQIEL